MALNKAVAAKEDFTYGYPNPPGVGYDAENNEVMGILMDIVTYPDGSPTVNTNHVKNPQNIKTLTSFKLSGDKASSGVGIDGTYRDPWGNAYIISMDLNFDEKCEDALYRKSAVSLKEGQTGYNGLFNNGVADAFVYNGGVMVWSKGPDGKADPGTKANQGVNKDNVLSWK
jgi:hypothetical protein